MRTGYTPPWQVDSLSPIESGNEIPVGAKNTEACSLLAAYAPRPQPAKPETVARGRRRDVASFGSLQSAAVQQREKCLSESSETRRGGEGWRGSLGRVKACKTSDAGRASEGWSSHTVRLLKVPDDGYHPHCRW